jgi:hypothetical protein
MKKQYWRTMLRHFQRVAAVTLLSTLALQAQQARSGGTSAPPDSAAIQALADSVRQLQAQVQAMQEQMRRLQTERDDTRAELSDLRRDLAAARPGSAPSQPVAADAALSASSNYPTAVSVAAISAAADSALPLNTDERVTRLEESEELAAARLEEHSQTKIESASKYRVRLSGIILLNLFTNRGNTDSIDVPQIAEPQDKLLGSPGSFGGTLRQSIIGLDVFGPQVAGAHTSASVKFDFAGGFPYQANGVSEGLVRLRTANMRLDWKNTSLVAGQDYLFFAPLSPTSIATLAVPPLSYAGNLWAWTPQVRVEHRLTLAENSTLTLQGGILDNLTGVTPQAWDGRYPSWGEQSGHPAFAARVALVQKVLGQNMTLGFGGFYGREDWGLDRNLRNVAGTVDLTLPLGRFFGFTGFFYRGQAVAGLGGGIGQSVLWSGDIMDPSTVFHGLKAEGGWAQLKFTPRSNFEINGGYGQDNPFARDLRRYGPNGSYLGSLLSRNQSPFANFIYRIKSDVMFSLEYRHLNTTFLDAGSQRLHHVNAALAYSF